MRLLDDRDYITLEIISGRDDIALETTLDWLVNFLNPSGVLVVWVDAQKPTANQSLRALLEKRGFVIEQGAVHECGCALSVRRLQTYPLQKAA